MIQTIQMFTVKCDNCGKSFEDTHQGFCAWNDADGAETYAIDSGWLKEEADTHYCPDCYYFDDYDNLTLREIQNEVFP